MEDWLDLLLNQFPESGRPMPEFGENIRWVVYQRYSFVYRIKNEKIEILTVYRENLP
jgi:plasmid stabilization system protein ParE